MTHNQMNANTITVYESSKEAIACYASVVRMWRMLRWTGLAWPWAVIRLRTLLPLLERAEAEFAAWKRETLENRNGTESGANRKATLEILMENELRRVIGAA